MDCLLACPRGMVSKYLNCGSAEQPAPIIKGIMIPQAIQNWVRGVPSSLGLKLQEVVGEVTLAR